MSDIDSAEFWNEALIDVIEELTPTYVDWAKRHVAKGSAFTPPAIGVPKFGWKDLQEKPVEEALQIVARMLINPATAADGLRVAAMIAERVAGSEQGGRDGQGAIRGPTGGY